jgi:hypothetical protein
MIRLENDKTMKRAEQRAAEARNFVAQLVPGQYLVISGRSEAEYKVLIVAEDGALWGECNCRAGREQMLCHHGAGIN